MEKSPQQLPRKNKRPSTSKAEDDMNSWDCSVCTYKNTPEAFKCLMCDARKGTSTRKPRPSPQIAPSVGVATSPSPPKNVKKENNKLKTTENSSLSKSKLGSRLRLRHIDRKTAEHKEVTVNNVTVVITEYKLKKGKLSSDVSGRSSSSGINSEAPSGEYSEGSSSDSADLPSEARTQ